MSLRSVFKDIIGFLAPGLLVVRGANSCSSVVLTFDDGPCPGNSENILGILRDAGVTATFFVTGKQAEEHPDLIRQLVDEGHEVGNHGYAHSDVGSVGIGQYVEDVVRTHELIEAITGRPAPRLFRPPYGSISLLSFLLLVRRGFRFVFWSFDSRDSFDLGRTEILQEVKNGDIGAGSILLFHEDSVETVAVLPEVIRYIQDQGLTFGSVAEITNSAAAQATETADDEPENSALESSPGYTGIIRVCSTILGSTSCATVLARSRSLVGESELRILAYHRICDIGNEDQYPFDPELVSASVEDFAWQMEYLKANYNPIGFRQLADYFSGRGSIGKRPVIVTFDDGFEDNYTNAFPILNRLGIPAAIFLTTGFIDGEEPFWYERVVFLLMSIPPGQIVIEGMDEPLVIDDGVESRRRACHVLLDHYKTVDNELREKDIARLCDQYRDILGQPAVKMSRPLSWGQIREMSRSGIEFGSHTVTHPILSRISDEADVMYELEVSRDSIAEHVESPIPVIAYPVGGRFAYDAGTISLARKAGYQFGVCYVTGVNRLDSCEQYELRRLHVERDIDRSQFKSMMALPEIFQSL